MATSDAELMAFAETLDKLASVAEDMPPDVASVEEEAESNLVEPFLEALGYRRTYTHMRKRYGPAEWNNKKVDYALLGSNGEPLILIECKSLSTTLAVEHWQQLREYYNDTEAKIGILTNGQVYNVYLDEDGLRGMDKEPFFHFKLGAMDDLAMQAAFRLTRLEDATIDLDGFKKAVDTWRFTADFKPRAMELFEDWRTHPDGEFTTFVETQVSAPEGSLGELLTAWFAEFTGIQGGPERGPSPPPKPSGGIPLPEWKIGAKKDLPTHMIFPDDPEPRWIRYGYDVPRETVRWLMANGFLTRESLPINYSSRSLVSLEDTHPGGGDMVSAKQVDWAFIEANYSPSHHVRNAKIIIDRVGQDPSTVLGVFTDKLEG